MENDAKSAREQVAREIAKSRFSSERVRAAAELPNCKKMQPPNRRSNTLSLLLSNDCLKSLNNLIKLIFGFHFAVFEPIIDKKLEKRTLEIAID